MAKETPDRSLGTLQMEIRDGEEAYNVSKRALKSLHDRGIFLQERPEYPEGTPFINEDGAPYMPHNLLDLTTQELGILYNVIEIYFGYVTGEFAKISLEYQEAQHVFKFISAKVRLGKEGKQQDKTDRQIADARYVRADARALETKCLYTLVGKARDTLEADLKMISRTITLREQEIKTGARGAALRARRAKIQWDQERSPRRRPPKQPKRQSARDDSPKVRRRAPPQRRPALSRTGRKPPPRKRRSNG